MLEVEFRPLAELRTDPRNARTHSHAQITEIAESIRRFGFTNPVLVGADDMIIAGHGRVAAARQLGRASVPTLRLDRMSSADRKAYVIADNRLAELAGWDKALLALEFKELEALDFDLSLTGFDLGEISTIIDLADGTPAEDQLREPDRGAPVSNPGDLWLLGEHRLLCGSALEKDVYERLMGADRAAVAFTDPPYNLKVQGDLSQCGRHRHQNFAMASGEMTADEFTAFLKAAFVNMTAFSEDGSISFVCMDWRHMGETLAAAKDTFSKLQNLVVWGKNNGGMGSLYRSQHELVFVFKYGRAPHCNTVQLGRNGRNRSNLWSYPGQNTFHRGRNQDLADHPTVKPVALVADALKDVSRRGDVVLDPFGGSGTTLIAAEKTGRRSRLIELEPRYVDVVVRRWEELTGQAAVHASTGRTFTDTASQIGASACQSEPQKSDPATMTLDTASPRNTRVSRKASPATRKGDRKAL